MSPPPIEQHVTFLYTQDLNKTAQFYEEIIGLSMVLDQGSCRIYRMCGDSFLGICQREAVSIQPEHIIITFVTHQVDAWYDDLKKQGIPFEKPPSHNPTYNIYHCFLRDPNGYLIEIQQFNDPNWPTPNI